MTRAMIMGILIVVMIVAVVVSYVINKKRHEQNAERATARGWTYHRKYPSMARELVKDLRGGRSGNAFTSVFEGTHDNEKFFAGTVKWTESRGSGDNQRTVTINHAVTVISLPLNSPFLRLEDEGFFSRVFTNDFKTEWEEFNKAWKVTGDDRRFISAILTPAMQEWLMRNQEYSYYLKPGWLMIYRKDKGMTADYADAMLAASTGFRGHILPFMWEDYGTRRRPS